jgi:hypothetical protein
MAGTEGRSPREDVSSGVSSRATSMAVAALICGIIGMIACLPAGLAALVLGPMTLRRIPRGSSREARGMALAGTICGFAGLLTTPYYVQVVRSYLDANRRTACAANFHAIGMALLLYGGGETSRPPPSLSELVEADFLNARFTKCPAAAIGESSYILLSAPDDRLPAVRLLAYEPKSHHRIGGHLLFGDGRVEFVSGSDFDKQIAAAIRRRANSPDTVRADP